MPMPTTVSALVAGDRQQPQRPDTQKDMAPVVTHDDSEDMEGPNWPYGGCEVLSILSFTMRRRNDEFIKKGQVLEGNATQSESLASRVESTKSVPMKGGRT